MLFSPAAAAACAKHGCGLNRDVIVQLDEQY